MNRFLCAAVLAWAGVCAAAEQTQPKKLAVGDPAPELKAMTWLKGAPVERFEPGRIYVVEFWATWCVPCVANIPHLNALAKKYPKDLTIVGVNVEGGSLERSLKEVTAFVNGQGAKMDYPVPMDDPRTKVLQKTWLKAAGYGGIPIAFIVDRTGHIIWMGPPVATLPNSKGEYAGKDVEHFDSVVARVIAGKFTAAEGTAEYNAWLKNNEDIMNGARRRAELLDPAYAAIRRRDYAAALAEYDRYLQRAKQEFGDVPENEGQGLDARLIALFGVDVKQGIAVSDRKLHDSFDQDTNYRIDVAAEAISKNPGLQRAAYEYMLARLEKFTLGREVLAGDISVKTTAARLNYRLGNLPEAVRFQQQAIRVLEANEERRDKAPQGYQQTMDMLRKDLAKYQAEPGTAVSTAAANSALIGLPLPAIAAQRADGKPLDLKRYSGKPMVVMTWTTGCELCKSLFPYYEKVRRQFSSRGVTFVAVSFDPDEKKSEWNAWLAQNAGAYGFEFARVEELQQARVKGDLEIVTQPMFYIVDAQGILVDLYSSVEGYAGADDPRLVISLGKAGVKP